MEAVQKGEVVRALDRLKVQVLRGVPQSGDGYLLDGHAYCQEVFRYSPGYSTPFS